MVLILRAVLFLGGFLFVLVSGNFLIDPVGQGGDFGVSPNGNKGLSTIRADFTAYFCVAGATLMIGAWKRRGDILLVPAALLGITLAARGLSLALDGSYEGWQIPMIAEAAVVVLALLGSWLIPRQISAPKI